MDVIAWVVALVVGIAQPSLRLAVAVGWGVSMAVNAYQYWFTDPRQWGQFPEDLYGAAAMLVVTALFAWVGSIIRARRGGDSVEVAP